MSNPNETKDLATAVVTTGGKVVTPQAATRPAVAVAVAPPKVHDD